MAFSPGEGLIECTTSLLYSEKYSDLTITTQLRSFKVHKAIVCTQSKVLAAMSDSGFKESSTLVLRLEHDDAATVERVLTFFYTGEYDQGKPDVTSGGARPHVDAMLMANTLVYSIADKYDIPRLKDLAKHKFEKTALSSGSKYFPSIVAAVFDTTPDADRGLRDVVANIGARHVDEVLANKAWIDLLNQNGAIGTAIFKVSRQFTIARVQAFRQKVFAGEQDLATANACIERLHKESDAAHEALQRILVKFCGETGVRDEYCQNCGDTLFENLIDELLQFKATLPTSDAGSSS